MNTIRKEDLIKEYDSIKQSTSIQMHSFLLYNLSQTIKSQITIEIFTEFLKEIRSHLNISLFIEVLWISGLELDKSEKIEKNFKDYKKNYNTIITQLETSGLVNSDILLERLDETQIKETNLIDYNQFRRKTSRINTKLNYVQQKFNLFREQNEGFSKIIIELLSEQYLNEETYQNILNNIISLIGRFDLDPNRVLDMILDAFECNTHNIMYLKLIENFNSVAIPHLLGFKLKNYTNLNAFINVNSLNNTLKNDKNITPRNLFIIIAYLVKRKILKIEDIWSHMGPSDQEIEENYNKRVELANKHFKSVYTIKLKQDSEQKKKAKEQEQIEVLEIYNQNIYNQKFWFMEALLSINAFEDFESIFSIFKYHILIQSHQPLLKTFYDLLEWMIDPLIIQYSPRRIIKKTLIKKQFIYEKDFEGQIKQADNIYSIEFYRNLSRILKLLGFALSENSLLIIKLCRVFKGYLKFNASEKGQEYIDNHADIINIIQTIMGKYLLPGLSLLKCNPGVITEFWSIFQEFDYKIRYSFYNEWLTNYQFNNPILIENLGITIKEINKWLKRLAKDKIKHNARSLGKLSHNNPVFVFNEIIKSIKSYSNQIVPMIGALNYSSNLSLDIIIFLVLRHISDPNRSQLRQYDANVEAWLLNISNFTGLFLKKNYNVEITGIFVYLCNRLGNGNTVDLILIKEIIAKMSGYDHLENLNEEQLQSLAGGPCLQMESASLTSEYRSAKKSMNSLENFFWKKTRNYISIQKNGENEQISFAFLLMIYLGQQRTKIIYNPVEKTQQLKLLGNLYDKINDTFNQFMQFLRFQTDSNTHFASLLPANCYPKLVLDYKISNEIAIAIVRNSIKKPNYMSDNERNEAVELFKDVFDKYDTFTMQKKREYSHDLTPTYFLKDAKEKMWTQINPEMYTLFWLFTLDDIFLPKARYDAEIEKLNKEILKLEESKTSEAQANSSKTAKSKIDKEIDKLKSCIEKLKEENSKLAKKKEHVESFFMSRKEKIFEGVIEKKYTILLSPYFIQFCILPRVIIEPSEALYCAKFIDLILRIKKISIAKIIENVHLLVIAILSCLQCATERESFNISVFFLELFQLFNYWNDETKLRAEIKKYSMDSFDYEQTKLYILLTYQKVVTIINVFVNKQKSYMHARNTLIFLEKLKNIFPVIKSQAEIILKCLENIKSMDMEDLKQMCESYEKILKRKMESMIDVDVKKLRETVRPKNQTVSTNISTIRRTDIRIDNLNENNSKHKEKEDVMIIEKDPSENKSERKRKSSKSLSDKDHSKKRSRATFNSSNQTTINLKKNEKSKDKNDLDTESFDNRDLKKRKEEPKIEKQSQENNNDSIKNRLKDKADKQKESERIKESDGKFKEISEKTKEEKSRDQDRKESDKQKDFDRQKDNDNRQKDSSKKKNK